MSKRKKARKGALVQRIKGLPTDVELIQRLDNGTELYVNTLGTVFAVRREQVVYRLLEGEGS